METMNRRTLLLGSAGLLLVGCSGNDGKDAKPSPKGPNIVKPRTGNVVTEADLKELAGRLNTALKSGDVKQLMGVIDAEDFMLDDFEKRWSRRLDNFGRLGSVDGEWYIGLPGGRTRNSAGGLIEYGGDLVFAHTVKGCDGQQVVESMRADFRKKSTDAPLELTHVGDVDASFDPSIWDVAEIGAIETKHAQIVFRLKDAKRAKAFAARIEAGARRAFEVMPSPNGVSKVFYALTWPAIDGKLWGGVAVGESDAHAYYHPFLDPMELARGQRKAAGNEDLPMATGRVGLHEGTFNRPDFEDVACHEAVHVLAEQWRGARGGAPIWSMEGLATWGERPGSGLMVREGARIRAAFPSFQSVALKGYDEFHKTPREYDYYMCAGAVYEYLDSEKGRDAVFETAAAFYGAEDRKAAAKKLGRSEKDLLAATRKWIGA